MKMDIDEEESYRLTKYGKKISKTDHNTVLVQMGIECTSSVEKKMDTKYNTRNVDARTRMQECIENDESFDPSGPTPGPLL